MLDEFLKILLCFLLALSLLISYLHGGISVENSVVPYQQLHNMSVFLNLKLFSSHL